MAARTALTATVFEKSLKLSENSISSGQLVNLLSNDSQRFEILLRWLPWVFASPLMFVIGLFLLSFLVDSYFVFMGSVMYLLLTPVNFKFSIRFGKLRDQVICAVCFFVKAVTHAHLFEESNRIESNMIP